MYLCPNCQYRIQDYERLCPACDIDVHRVGILNEIPDRLYNEALRSVEQNDLITASTKCNAALQQRSRDPELWMLMGMIYARMGAFPQAQQCFQTVVYFNSQYQPATEFLSRIETLMANSKN